MPVDDTITLNPTSLRSGRSALSARQLYWCKEGTQPFYLHCLQHEAKNRLNSELTLEWAGSDTLGLSEKYSEDGAVFGFHSSSWWTLNKSLVQSQTLLNHEQKQVPYTHPNFPEGACALSPGVPKRETTPPSNCVMICDGDSFCSPSWFFVYLGKAARYWDSEIPDYHPEYLYMARHGNLPPTEALEIQSTPGTYNLKKNFLTDAVFRWPRSGEKSETYGTYLHVWLDLRFFSQVRT